MSKRPYAEQASRQDSHSMPPLLQVGGVHFNAAYDQNSIEAGSKSCLREDLYHPV